MTVASRSRVPLSWERELARKQRTPAPPFRRDELGKTGGTFLDEPKAREAPTIGIRSNFSCRIKVRLQVV